MKQTKITGYLIMNNKPLCLWSDFHSNLHSEHLPNLDEWYDFAKDMLDFWAPVYYPYYVNHLSNGFSCEAELEETQWKQDWEFLRSYCAQKEAEFPLYLSYEWQGDGKDGDHNIFFRDFYQSMKMPITYEELTHSLVHQDTIAIPHHTGYASGHRGKNWENNDEMLSPVTEIYSSHGCSQSSDCEIPMNVHIHMGPRGETGTYYYALQQGQHIGVIASGDNHVCPAISGNGFFAVLCDQYHRDDIFNAIKEKHTYAVTRNRMKLDVTIKHAIIGSTITKKNEERLPLHIEVLAGNAIDRIEIIRNGIVEHIIPHSGTWERRTTHPSKFKFEIEFGWGPDCRVFPEIHEKLWNVSIHSDASITDVEKLWTSPGSTILSQEEHEVKAKIITRKYLPGNGKLSQKNHLTPNIQNQSLIFEVEGKKEDHITLNLDGKVYQYTIEDLLTGAQLIALEEEVEQLLKDTYQFCDYEREDPWWHNAYKVCIHKAAPYEAYHLVYDSVIQELEKEEDSIMVKVIQKNAETAWTSPIWIKGENK